MHLWCPMEDFGVAAELLPGRVGIWLMRVCKGQQIGPSRPRPGIGSLLSGLSLSDETSAMFWTIVTHLLLLAFTCSTFPIFRSFFSCPGGRNISWRCGFPQLQFLDRLGTAATQWQRNLWRNGLATVVPHISPVRQLVRLPC